MNANILHTYVDLCKEGKAVPTWDGLLKYYQEVYGG